MKLILMVAAILFGHGLRGQTQFHDPVDYNSFIVREQRKVVKKNLDYISFAVHSEDLSLIENKRKEVLRQIGLARKKIESLPPFEGDTRLRNEAIEVLSQYEKAFSQDFKQVIERRRRSNDSFEAMEAYFDLESQAERQVVFATQKFNKVQAGFVERYNLAFENNGKQDSLTIEMLRIAALNQYLREIFLVYFKVFEAFSEMLQVMYEQKNVLLEKKRQHVVAVADQALEALRSYGPFNGESSYLDQTQAIVQFYRGLAGEEFAKIVSLMKKKSGLTRDDVQYVNDVLRRYQLQEEDLMQRLYTANNDLLLENIKAVPSAD